MSASFAIATYDLLKAKFKKHLANLHTKSKTKQLIHILFRLIRHTRLKRDKCF